MINFQRNLILGKEELNRFYQFLSKNSKILSEQQTESSRLLYPVLSSANSLRPIKNIGGSITVGSGYVLNLTEEIGYLNEFLTETLSAPVGSPDLVLYVVLTDEGQVGWELDTVAEVTSSNQLTLSGTAGQWLRDMSGLDNTKIKFQKTGLLNTGVYDIVSKIDNNNFTISGNLSNETDLRIVIVGTYDLERIQPTTDLYAFHEISANIYDPDTDLAEIQAGAVVGKIVFNDAGTDYELFDVRGEYETETFKFSEGSDFLEGVGAVTTKELKFVNVVHQDSNTYLKFSSVYELQDDSLILPATSKDLSRSDFVDDGSVYLVKSGISSAINTITVTGEQKNGFSLELMADNTSVNEILIYTTSNYNTPNAIFHPDSIIFRLKRGTSLKFIKNEYGSWNAQGSAASDFVQDEWKTVDSEYGAKFSAASGEGNFGVRYRKTLDGQLQIYGSCVSVVPVAVNDPIFTLPEGYRPSRIVDLPASTAYRMLTVLGRVVNIIVSNGVIYLDEPFTDDPGTLTIIFNNTIPLDIPTPTP